MLDLDAARRRLHFAAAHHGVIRTEAPDWVVGARRHRGAFAWLDVTPLAFPLYRESSDGAIVAATCLTPGEDPVGASVRVRAA